MISWYSKLHLVRGVFRGVGLVIVDALGWCLEGSGRRVFPSDFILKCRCSSFQPRGLSRVRPLVVRADQCARVS